MEETQLPGRRSSPARTAGVRWFSGVALAALGGWLLLATGASARSSTFSGYQIGGWFLIAALE